MSSHDRRVSSKIPLHCLLWRVSETDFDASFAGNSYKCESSSLKRMVRNLSLALVGVLEGIRINLNSWTRIAINDRMILLEECIVFHYLFTLLPALGQIKVKRDSEIE